MSIVGFVTRVGGSDFFSQSPSNFGGTGGVRYAARKPDGTSLGNYRDAGAALNAFRRLSGPGRIYQIQRKDLPSGVEHYEVISDPPSPNQIFPNGELVFWVEPQFNPKVVTSPPAGNDKVLLLGSRTPKINGAFATLFNGTLADQGTLSPSDVQFNQRDVLSTDNAMPQFYSSVGLSVNSALANTLAPPYSLWVVCNHTSAAAIAVGAAALSVNSGNVTIGNPAGTGNWAANNGAAIASAVPISLTTPDVVLFEQDTTGAALWVNGVMVGSNGTVPIAGGPLDVAQNPDFWRGKFAHVSVLSQITTSTQRDLMFRYLSTEFQ